MQILHLKCLALFWVTKDFVCEKLLEDLSMVYLLFNGTGCQQAEYCNFLLLTQSPSTLPRLYVCRRVPVRIKYNNPIRPSKINSEAANLSGEEEHVNARRTIEFIHQVLSILYISGPVHAAIVETPQVLNKFLNNVEHNTSLAK